MTFLCALFPFFLGAAFGSLLLWFFCLPWNRRYNSPPPRSINQIILGLTKECEQALGECARPGRLRQMRPEAIEKLLRAKICNIPRDISDLRYDTWPSQADQLCRGQYDDLRRWQLIQTNDTTDTAPDPIASSFSSLLLWPWLSLLLLLLSLFFYILSGYYRWCDTQAITCPPPPPCRQELRPCSPKKTYEPAGIDGYFEYKESRLSDPDGLVREIKEIISKYSSIKLQGIATFTDPIGGMQYNKRLSEERAAAIKRAVKQTIEADPEAFKSVDIRLSDLDQITTSGRGPSLSDKDQKKWNECLRIHQDSQPEKFRPLVKTSFGPPDIATDEEQSAGYDLFEPRHFKEIKDVQSRLKAEKNFKDLRNCLKPMRRVEFEGEGVKISELSQCNIQCRAQKSQSGDQLPQPK